MTRKKRSAKGQSMVEYALGIGCVAAVCMVALGSLGNMAGDMIWSVQNAINYGEQKAGEPGLMVDRSAKPWQIE